MPAEGRKISSVKRVVSVHKIVNVVPRVVAFSQSSRVLLSK